MFLVFQPGKFLSGDNTQTDKQPQRDIVTDRKYMHINTVILLKYV